MERKRFAPTRVDGEMRGNGINRNEDPGIVFQVPQESENLNSFWDTAGKKIREARQVYVGIVHAYSDNGEFPNTWIVTEFGIPPERRNCCEDFEKTVDERAKRKSGKSGYSLISVRVRG